MCMFRIRFRGREVGGGGKELVQGLDWWVGGSVRSWFGFRVRIRGQIRSRLRIRFRSGKIGVKARFS